MRLCGCVSGCISLVQKTHFEFAIIKLSRILVFFLSCLLRSLSLSLCVSVYLPVFWWWCVSWLARSRMKAIMNRRNVTHFIWVCFNFVSLYSPKWAHNVIVSSFCRRCILATLQQRMKSATVVSFGAFFLLVLCVFFRVYSKNFVFLVNQRCFLPFRGNGTHNTITVRFVECLHWI